MRVLASTPRFSGSERESEARAYCAARLESAGYSVEELPFTFSAFPSRWAPAMSALVLAAASMAVGHRVFGHEPLEGLAIGVGVPLLLWAAARYLTRRGILDLPLARTSSVNLAAVRGDSSPRIWLVAHVDSKSQTIPMLVRIASVALFVLMYSSLLAATVAIAIVDSPHSPLERTLATVVHFAAAAGAVSLLPLIACFIGNRSPGALDNASGVAAVLLAAETITDPGVGVLITSAEELGLAGARAFARDRGENAIAINCDTVDDAGNFLTMKSGGPSLTLDGAIGRAADRLGISIRRGLRGSRLRPMLPGVLADNIAFSDAGWKSFTLSRGNLGTLARVHTSSDRAESIDGTGIASAALLIVAIVEELS